MKMSKCELKPCPFCGGKAEIDSTGIGYTNGSFSENYEIGCKSCNIRFRGTSYFIIKDGTPTISIDGYKECIEKWNRRANI